MIKCALFEYVSGEKRAFHDWLCVLDKRSLGKLNQRLDQLELHGVAEFEKAWCPSLGKGIYKIRVPGQVALRPRLCKGPLLVDAEATLLLGVNKKDNVESPPGADQKAAELKKEIEQDPQRKRRRHDRVK